MGFRTYAAAELRHTWLVLIGILALLASVLLLFVGVAHAGKHEMEPDSSAINHCGGARFDIAKWWFVGSGGALMVTLIGFYGYARRSNERGFAG